MSEHARIGPSSLERVSLCAGSVNATAGLPRTTNRAAAEGTLLHEIASDCLDLGLEPWDHSGRTMVADGYSFDLGEGADQTDPECMVEAMDWIREQPGELFVETRVSLDPYLPAQFGTLDVGIYHPSLLTVFDWKFGFILVPVLNNKQVRAYAIGFITLLRERGYKIPKRIRLIIEQPRAPGGDRYFTPWEISLDELMDFTRELEEIWAAANDPDAPHVAGEKQCRFCQAKDEPGGCYAHTTFMLDLASLKMEDVDAEDVELPDPGVISPERRSFIVRHRSMFVSWLDHLQAATLGDALAGRSTPGLKAIDGPEGVRAWADPEAAQAAIVPVLADLSFTKKLISPPQAEKLMKKTRKNPGHPETWDALQALIHRPPGQPALVSAEDPRPAKLTAEDRFEEVED